jgi:hypothetical protein
MGRIFYRTLAIIYYGLTLYMLLESQYRPVGIANVALSILLYQPIQAIEDVERRLEKIEKGER